MTNVSLRDQFTTIQNNNYPFIRRDKEVRARVLASFNDSEDGIDKVLIATFIPNGPRNNRRVAGRPNPLYRAYDLPESATIRVVTTDYFDNNYWTGQT
jgi:hypothetical protein